MRILTMACGNGLGFEVQWQIVSSIRLGTISACVKVILSAILFGKFKFAEKDASFLCPSLTVPATH
ncbi:MAG: hypothetical protein WC460_01330 [Patescibacteria group bacterium]